MNNAAANRRHFDLMISGPADARGRSDMKTFTPKIRTAIEQDFDQLCELFKELDSFHVQAKPEFFRPVVGPAREHGFISNLITGPESTILVADDDSRQQLLGFATLIIHRIPENVVRPARIVMEIENIGVRERMQRKGVGQALVTNAVEWAVERGIKKIELSVHEFNVPAIGFYEALGFRTRLRRMSFDANL